MSSLTLWCAAGLLLSLLIDSTLSYSFYGTRIPNGRNVLHPCTSNIEWLGVGHFSHTGGGPRNQFGLDFSIAGHTWTRELCEKDSDNDGRSNGVELGDPDCVWQEGDTPASSITSHPGICEPVDSPLCRNQSSFSCEGSIGFDCPAVNEPGVESFDLRLPELDVPNVETTYMCTLVKMPVTAMSHVIAYEPIVDNANVLHHIILYGCTEPVDLTETVFPCGMSPRQCRSLLEGWTFGIEGRCIHPTAGVPIGPGSYEYLVMNVHWNNPQRTAGYTDSSGLKLFYTENLRENNAQMMNIGQLMLNIPPLTDRVVQTAICQSRCTRALEEPLYVITATVHMHYLGAGGRIELYREGELIDYIVDDDTFNYESPLTHEFDPPKVILPGDEIRVQCYFNSLDEPNRRTTSTYFGQATSDEMCFGFMMYYPGPSTPANSFTCIQYGGIDICPAILANDCDDCYAYNVLIEMSEYLTSTQTCSVTCSSECLEQLVPAAVIPCVQNVARKMRELPSVPAEFKPAIDAMNMCESQIPPRVPNQRVKSHPVGNGVSRMINFIKGGSDEAVDACQYELPPFEDCGLNIPMPDGGMHITWSYITIMTATLLAYLNL